MGQVTQSLTAQRHDAGHLFGDGFLTRRVVGLDNDVTLGLNIVLSQDGTNSLGGVQDELVGGLGGRVVEFLLELGELGSHNRNGLIFGATRQTLPQVLGDEGHDRMDESQSSIQSGVKGLLSRLLSLGGSISSQEELGVLNEDVTQLAVPVLVGSDSDAGELTGLE